uniref:Uncharacterized protein n=1 Tax=Anguilla anguilla TaxID=7936 RepID=A0A0E9U113_ANGAN
MTVKSKLCCFLLCSQVV